MPYMNQVTIMGHLGQDAKIIETQNGVFGVFSMAVNKSWKDKTTGEWKKVTAWVDVTVPTRLMQYTLQKTTYAKGDLALVAGTLATKVAKTKSGEEYTKLFVQAETVANLTKSTSEDTTTAPDTIDASL